MRKGVKEGVKIVHETKSPECTHGEVKGYADRLVNPNNHQQNPPNGKSVPKKG